MAAMTLAQRLERKIDFTDGCWLWTGGNNGAGYGVIWRGDRLTYAHRASYELLVGPIPPGMELDHLCRNRACVRPEHLEPVSPAENAHRGLNGVLKKTCANGHPWVPENITSNGPRARCCRICRDHRNARRYGPVLRLEA